MSKETLRELFGESDDVSPELETMFGRAYLDFEDDTRVTDGKLQQLAESRGKKLFDITGLCNRAVEMARDLTCAEIQDLLIFHLRNFMNQDFSAITWEDIWATTKHLRNCDDSLCHQLHDIATWDNILTPEEMKRRFGNTIEDILKSRREQ